MKKFFSRNTIIAFIIGILVGPGIALAQLTVPQGGTGQTAFTTDQIIYGNSSLRLGSEAAFTYDPDTNKMVVVNASTTNTTVGGYFSFDGVVGTSWTDFCTSITGSASLCDGSDATGSGGTGLATSTAIADTYVIYGTSASDVGAEAAFTYDDATNKLTFGYGSSTAFSATTLFGSLVGNADTATALAANGSNCSAGSFPLGVDASGAVESCTDAWTEAENTAAGYLDSADIGVNVQAYSSRLASIATLSPASSLLIGNGIGGYELITPANFITNNNILDTADIGMTVQGYDADLAAIAALTEADSTFIVGTGAGWTTESGATVRTSLGLGSLATLSAISTTEITDGTITEADLKAVDTASDEECLTYEVTTGDFEWQACGSGSGDLWSDPVDSDILPDTDSTRDIGADANRFALGYFDTLYATQMRSDYFFSPTTYLNVYNSAGKVMGSFIGSNGASEEVYIQMSANVSGSAPEVRGAGSNTNVAVNIVPKGSGEAQVNGQEIIDESMISTGLTYSAGLVTADLGTSIAAAEIDNDTITNAQIDDADQTTTMCIYIEDPTADDDLKSIWANKTANDFLLTEMWAESDQTVNLDLQVDDGTPADVNGTDISPAAGEAEDTTLSGDTTVAAGEELDLAITSVSGTPTWVSICWTGNWVD